MNDALDNFEKAKAGDPIAFQAMVRPHLDAIRRFARSFCGNDNDADDLAQDALLKAFRAFGSFDGRSSLTTWLFAVAKNHFLDNRRGKLFRWRSREVPLGDTDLSPLPNAEHLLNERQRVEFLWSALRRIDEKFRTPLVLAEIDGISYEEIAQIEGLPIGTVRSRIARAKDHLRALVGQSPEVSAACVVGTLGATESSNTITKGVR